MTEQEKGVAIQKFKESIISLILEGIKPQDVSNYIWKHNTDESFSDVYKYIKELAEAID